MKIVRRQRWLKLDNAAKIFPAARTRSWTNVFRLSVTLTEEIDPEILQKSVQDIKKRFPSICVRLSNGMFWYYIEETKDTPTVQPEGPHACMKMEFSEIKKCSVRILYYKNRISVEFFHSLTDGNGALVFIKTLAATYLENRYGIDVPHSDGVLDISVRAKGEELEDSFLKYAGKIPASRRDTDAYMHWGTPLDERFTPLVTGVLDISDIKKECSKYGVSVTTYLASVMAYAIQSIQEAEVPKRKHKKPIKIFLPVNLRNFYPSSTLRNFILFVIPAIETKYGHFEFDEIVKSFHHQIAFKLTEKNMSSIMATNVKDELNPALRVVPLFIKNIVMKAVYNLTGERKSSITISNLGNVKLPEIMDEYIERFDFILTPQCTQPNGCSIISYKGKLYISFVRKIKEPKLEQAFFTTLVKMGIHVKIESNRR
ncbi:MAG: alcohol acetyltransferase [Clostridia bacterium]|nr:alcohol acetyltransferase [Clostridia bacterium]